LGQRKIPNCMAVKLEEARFCNNRDKPWHRGKVSDASLYEVFNPFLSFRLVFSGVRSMAWVGG